MTSDNWLYRRLEEASARVDAWTPEQKACINYHFNEVEKEEDEDTLIDLIIEKFGLGQ